jgi:acetylserotonin N-methyltransferase
MARDVSIPDPQPVLELLVAFRRSKAMFAAVKLGIFDALQSGPQSAQDLAETIGANETALARLLDALTGMGLLVSNQIRYANSPAAATYLTSQSPRRMTGYIHYSSDFGWKLWDKLEDAVREGTHRWQQVYGWDGPIFSNFFKDDHAKQEFLMGMHGFGMISSPVVAGAFDLSRFQRFVDVGGATGHLAIAVCQRYPRMQGIVFDLPAAVPLASEIVAASGVADRVTVVGGDFFVDPLPAADLYALGRILHDWSDDKCLALLRKIFESLPQGGALLVAEKLLLEDRSGPDWAQMQDLNMLTCTEGRERTLADYEELLGKAGFSDVTGCRTNSPLDAVLAIK